MKVRFTAYVRNPFLDEDIQLLGVSEKWEDAVMACLTEADTIGHDDACELAKEALDRKPAGSPLQIWNFDNGDGITYHVVPTHNIDAN